MKQFFGLIAFLLLAGMALAQDPTARLRVEDPSGTTASNVLATRANEFPRAIDVSTIFIDGVALDVHPSLTISGTPTYITLDALNQILTLLQVDLADPLDITGILALANGGHGGTMTNGQLIIGSTGVDPVVAALTGTANQIIVVNGAGLITLSAPQDIHTGAIPTFVGLTLSGLTPNSVTFAGAGGLITEDTLFVWDTVNNRLGLNIAVPLDLLHLAGGTDPAIRIAENAGFPFIIEDISASTARLNKQHVGVAVIELNPEATDGSSGARLEIFRQTNTTGVKAVQLMRGNATGTIHVQLAVDGDDSYFNGGGAFIYGQTTLIDAAEFSIDFDTPGGGGFQNIGEHVAIQAFDPNIVFVDKSVGSDFAIHFNATTFSMGRWTVGNRTSMDRDFSINTANGNVTIEQDLNVEGQMLGQRSVFTAGLETTNDIVEMPFLAGGAQVGSADPGFGMMRPGSIVGVAMSGNVSGITSSGTIAIRVYVNDSLVFSVTSATISATGDITVVGTKERGVETFVAGDRVQLDHTFTTLNGTIIDATIAVEVVFDT